MLCKYTIRIYLSSPLPIFCSSCNKLEFLLFFLYWKRVIFAVKYTNSVKTRNLTRFSFFHIFYTRKEKTIYKTYTYKYCLQRNNKTEKSEYKIVPLSTLNLNPCILYTCVPPKSIKATKLCIKFYYLVYYINVCILFIH